MDKETAQETAIDTPEIIEERMANRRRLIQEYRRRRAGEFNRLRMEARGTIGY